MNEMNLAMARREFLARTAQAGLAVGAFVVGSSAVARTLSAQEEQPQRSAASNVEMSTDAYKPVSLPAKPDAKPVMSNADVNTFEKGLSCPCPCTQDVYSCRTTDLTCGISPAVHDDIMAMVNGGHSGEEIMAALTGTYGDFILMEPRKEGFNLLAWFAPFAALGIGAVGIGTLLRGWRRNARAATVARGLDTPTVDVRPIAQGHIDASIVPGATPIELERLEAALRDGGR